MVFSITSINSTQAKTNVSNKTQSFPDDKTLKKAAEQLGISVEQLKENLTQSRVAKNKGIYNLAVTVNEMDMKAFCILNGIDYNDWRNHNADSNRMYYVIKNPKQYINSNTNTNARVSGSNNQSVSSTQEVNPPASTTTVSTETTTPNANSVSTVAAQPLSADERSYYIITYPPKIHSIKRNESLWILSQKYGISTEALLAANPQINENTVLSVGQKINIPSAREIKNVRNLTDVARAMGVSQEFINSLKLSEDPKSLALNDFHNTPYTDNAGVRTIGVGHAIQNSDDRNFLIKRYGNCTNLTDAQVCDLFASDLLEAEENIAAIIGQDNYDKLPSPMKEALLDMVFNKGKMIIKDAEGLAYCLKNGNYEAAINKFTNIKSVNTGKEMAGLAKRRLYDISLAIKMYPNDVPASNVATAQSLYDRGVELLRQECSQKKLNFADQIVGFNQDIQGYFGDRVQLQYITE